MSDQSRMGRQSPVHAGETLPEHVDWDVSGSLDFMAGYASDPHPSSPHDQSAADDVPVAAVPVAVSTTVPATVPAAPAAISTSAVTTATATANTVAAASSLGAISTAGATGLVAADSVSNRYDTLAEAETARYTRMAAARWDPNTVVDPTFPTSAPERKVYVDEITAAMMCMDPRECFDEEAALANYRRAGGANMEHVHQAAWLVFDRIVRYHEGGGRISHSVDTRTSFKGRFRQHVEALCRQWRVHKALCTRAVSFADSLQNAIEDPDFAAKRARKNKHTNEQRQSRYDKSKEVREENDKLKERQKDLMQKMGIPDAEASADDAAVTASGLAAPTIPSMQYQASPQAPMQGPAQHLVASVQALEPPLPLSSMGPPPTPRGRGRPPQSSLPQKRRRTESPSHGQRQGEGVSWSYAPVPVGAHGMGRATNGRPAPSAAGGYHIFNNERSSADALLQERPAQRRRIGPQWSPYPQGHASALPSHSEGHRQLPTVPSHWPRELMDNGMELASNLAHGQPQIQQPLQSFQQESRPLQGQPVQSHLPQGQLPQVRLPQVQHQQSQHQQSHLQPGRAPQSGSDQQGYDQQGHTQQMSWW